MYSRSLLAAAALTAMAAQPSSAQTLPGFSFETFRAPAVANPARCSGAANTSAQLGAIQFAQTNLMATSHPFFHLSANRDALIRVAVTGSGSSPVVWVQGAANGKYLGRFCLSGPASLPASVDIDTPSYATSFFGTVPAAWMKPGLQLQVTAAGKTKTVTAQELKIGASPVLTFVTSDWYLFGDTAPTPLPAGFAQEFASKLPLTAVQFSRFPLDLKLAELPIPPRSDARQPDGTEYAGAAMLATANSRCSAANKTAGTCLPWSGYGILGAVRSMTGILQKANGMDRLSHWYGATSLHAHQGGGLGGGTVGSGDDYDTIFNHELGHAFDMPHWGGDLYSRSTTVNQKHPYTGQVPITATPTEPVGGGFGNSWAYDSLAGATAAAFVNPICAALGRERQEPMQRSGSACLQPGRLFDHFGDYSSLYVHRYFVGATAAYSGTIAVPRNFFGNPTPDFAFPVKSGRPNLTLGATPTVMRWNATSAAYEELTPARVSSTDSRIYGERYPLQWNVPVHTIWGSFSTTDMTGATTTSPRVTTIQAPLTYTGHLKRLWDPTNATDFAAMKAFVSGDGFWWGRDLVVKVDFADGTVRHALVDAVARSTDPTSSNSFAYWAVNIPATVTNPVKTVTLYYRPMDVRYAGTTAETNHPVEYNLNNPMNAGVNAGNYLSTAVVAAVRSF